jgi:hypothetical protein
VAIDEVGSSGPASSCAQNAHYVVEVRLKEPTTTTPIDYVQPTIGRTERYYLLARANHVWTAN